MRKLLIVLGIVFVLGCNVLICAENENDKKKTPQELADNLIKECGGINQPNKAGLTPLQQAVVMIDNKKVAKILLKKGADLKKTDIFGNTPLNYLLGFYWKEEFLKERYLREDKFNRLYEMVKLLVDKGADINTNNKEGKTPLFLSCDFRGYEPAQYTERIARFLIEKGADVKVKDKAGATTLHRRIPRENAKVAEMLIARGADVNARDEYGTTPLHLTSTLEGVKLLIAKGADVNAKNKDEYTPLHGAMSRGDVEIAKALIEKGAEVNARYKDGSTPLDNAKAPKMVAFLRQHGGKTICELIKTEAEIAAEADRLIKLSGGINGTQGDGVTPICKAIQMDHKGVVECLVSRGADVNLKTKHGLMPLHYAVSGFHLRHDDGIAKMLTSKNADVNGKNLSGETPLHKASGSGHVKLIELFVACGAKLEMENNVGDTPLHCAAWSNGHPEAVKILVEKGANINARNKKRETPLDKAMESCLRMNRNKECFEVVKYIQDKGGKSGK